MRDEKWKLLTWTAFLLLGSACLLPAQDPGTQRVLVIGIDGVRPDALAAARTPNLDKLIQTGAFADSTQILGTRYRKSDTISGPGWSSILTGVWADKHGVHDNEFKGKNYKQFPHFFERLKAPFPQARTASFVDWSPIDEHIVSAADLKKNYPSANVGEYIEHDAEIARDASRHLQDGDPHATMVYFGSVDETGHKVGFHPSVKPYVAAIEVIDRHVGQLLRAIDARPSRAGENWLVLVSTDHGGRGTGHGSGHKVPEIRTVFLIVSGTAARQGKIQEQTYLVDLPVTALVHLGVKIDPAWKLDGRSVGLK
ncbi:MAG: alkaline phosphatase family protein [Pirellulaceae bacterium]|jgi:predicted AlkP superfamily pyrophosphatase or phosphodiesterase|nr:alkaline phosphatase family protein [Pirellulaceae bacterium]